MYGWSVRSGRVSLPYLLWLEGVFFSDPLEGVFFHLEGVIPRLSQQAGAQAGDPGCTVLRGWGAGHQESGLGTSTVR